MIQVNYRILPVELDLLSDERDCVILVCSCGNDTHDSQYNNADLNEPTNERNTSKNGAADKERHSVVNMILNVCGLSYVARDDVEHAEEPEETDVCEDGEYLFLTGNVLN